MGVTGLHIIAIHIGVEINHIAVAFCPSCIGDGSVQGGIDIVPHACPKVGSLVGTDTAEHGMDTPHQGKFRGDGEAALQRIEQDDGWKHVGIVPVFRIVGKGDIDA